VLPGLAIYSQNGYFWVSVAGENCMWRVPAKSQKVAIFGPNPKFSKNTIRIMNF